jgi:hypothetical protein
MDKIVKKVISKDNKINILSTQVVIKNEELVCKNCKKNFKTKKSKTRHQIRQICIPKEKRTFCETCNFTAPDKTVYKNHLLSEEHLSKLVNIIPSKVNIDTVPNLFNLDPYLSKKEKQDIINPYSISNITELTFKHKDNTISRINTAQENAKIAAIEQKKKEAVEIKRKEDEAKKYINGVHYIAEPENKLDYQSILKAELFTIPPKTIRQEKIINFLIRAQNANEQVKKDKLKQILRLITMDEANYLMSHIRSCEELSISSKQFYMNFIDKFIMELVKLMNNGIKVIDNKNIEQFIAKLSK